MATDQWMRLGKAAAALANVAILGGCTSLAGWMAPAERLTFPVAPKAIDSDSRSYDVDGDGRIDFAIRRGENGLLDRLEYDDDEDGAPDRAYRLSDYRSADVPHVILLIDSLPHRVMAARYAAGDWGWFFAPQKVIPPFPSLSEVIFTAMLHAPPLAGNVERSYDRRTRQVENLWVARAFGYLHPWQRRLDAKLDSFLNVGMSYLNPRPWYEAELAAAKTAVDTADHRVVIAYVVSSSAMLSRYGAVGLEECLARIEQISMQLIYERRGAVKISIVSDHGHNLAASANFPAEEILVERGFQPTEVGLERSTEVVMDIDGLVTYFGVHTSRPEAVAEALLPRSEVQLAIYQRGETIVVRDRTRTAVIDRRGGRFRYSPRTGDPLEYESIVERLRSDAKIDADGFVDDLDWLAATADARYPDGPRRLWDAFHGQVVNPPDVMVTLNEGSCAGLESMESWISMQSTHGGLEQSNSDAVVMTMTGSIDRPLRTKDVLAVIEPSLLSLLSF